jgi:hypothetical protein
VKVGPGNGWFDRGFKHSPDHRYLLLLFYSDDFIHANNSTWYRLKYLPKLRQIETINDTKSIANAIRLRFTLEIMKHRGPNQLRSPGKLERKFLSFSSSGST